MQMATRQIFIKKIESFSFKPVFDLHWVIEVDKKPARIGGQNEH